MMELPTIVKSGAATVAAIGAIGGGAYTLDNRYVSVGEFQSVAVELLYEGYYKAEDAKRHADSEGDTKRSQEAERRMARLKAKICKIEPHWEKCLDE